MLRRAFVAIVDVSSARGQLDMRRQDRRLRIDRSGYIAECRP
jgi:hypothetical protein